MRATRDSRRHRLVRNFAAVVCALFVYYGVPLDLEIGPVGLIGIALFLVGVGGLGWLTTRRIRHLLARPETTGRQVDGILLLLTVMIVFFALSYYLLDQRDPGQFDGIETRTDALYYTVVTLGTVGYGDVHATGQAARVVTMVQIVFDLVVVGVLLAVGTTSITRRLSPDRTGP